MAEVLIVEPRTDLRLGLARVLEARGHVVFTAEEAEEALSLSAQTHPTVVLLDMSLPEIPAESLLQVLRNVPPYHQAWIAAVGEHALPAAPGSGLNASIREPLTAEALYARLASLPGCPLAEERVF